jgi:hypothetical protein
MMTFKLFRSATDNAFRPISFKDRLTPIAVFHGIGASAVTSSNPLFIVGTNSSKPHAFHRTENSFCFGMLKPELLTAIIASFELGWLMVRVLLAMPIHESFREMFMKALLGAELSLVGTKIRKRLHTNLAEARSVWQSSAKSRFGSSDSTRSRTKLPFCTWGGNECLSAA